MIDKSHIGHSFEPFTVEIEKGRLKFFARATGQENPIYLDEDAAKAAGYSSLPAAPTFLFSIDLEQDNPMGFLEMLGVDIARILHGAGYRVIGGRCPCGGARLSLRISPQVRQICA